MFLNIARFTSKKFVRNYALSKDKIKPSHLLMDATLNLKQVKVQQLYNYCQETQPGRFKSRRYMKNILQKLKARGIFRTHRPEDSSHFVFEFTPRGKRWFLKKNSKQTSVSTTENTVASQ